MEIMINDEADEITKELFDALKNKHRNNLESIKGSAFVFNYVHLLYYKCHKINPNRGRSHTDSLNWVKKKATVNTINKKDNKCFQYAVTVALNHEQIGKHAERIAKIKPFVNKYKWERKKFHQKKMIEKNEKNNVTIALNVSYVKKRKNIFCLCFKT